MKERNTTQQKKFVYFLSWCLLWMAYFSSSCQVNNNTCTEETNGFESCYENSIVLCHGDIEKPHFDQGQDCEQQGFTCKAVSTKDAVCIDAKTTCTGTEAKCDTNQAMNCIEGNFAVVRCGASRNCTLKDGKATCKSRAGEEECSGHGTLREDVCVCEPGYKRAEQNPKECVSSK